MPQARSVRSLLRAETAPDHARVDRAFSRFDLSDPADYRAFLIAQAGPLMTVETAVDAVDPAALLPDWSLRRRAPLIRADLADLDAPIPDPEPFDLPSDAALLGAIYVLEGSRLGGAMLARHVPEELPARFLRCPPAAARWQRLIEVMDESLRTPDQRTAAIETARDVFDRYWRSAHEYGRTPVVE